MNNFEIFPNTYWPKTSQHLFHNLDRIIMYKEKGRLIFEMDCERFPVGDWIAPLVTLSD
jgi:hypothetical protein